MKMLKPYETVIYKDRIIERQLHKQVPATTGEGVVSVPDGAERVTYAVILDEHQITCMARVAARSKGQQAKDGPLRVVIQSRERI